MATVNDITGDVLQSRASNDNYRNNYDNIFKKRDEMEQQEREESRQDQQGETDAE